MGKYYKTILNEDCGSEEMFYKISDYALTIGIKYGFNKLDEIEKKFFMVGFLLMEVNNGGFDLYFVDGEGEKYARHTLHFLNLIGEKKFSNLLNMAIDIFESNKIYDEKLKELDDIDSEFYKFLTPEYNKLYEKCIGYLKDSVNQIN